METPREKEHLLALKVMRLTKPSLATITPISCDMRDLAGHALMEAQYKDFSSTPGIDMFTTGSLMLLPQNFGNIFLGETFSCYVSVHNDSQQIVKNVVIKADLQTSSHRLALASSNNTITSELTPESSIDDVIHHEVKDLGTHILVYSVSYNTQNGEKMYFRKFYKFQVLKPLDVKTKFYNAESNEVYLEAQIQNITNSTMCMEKVVLEPSAFYTVNELNVVGEKSTFGRMNYMKPMDNRQYLYQLIPTAEAGDKINRAVACNIGKLDITWKTNLGEKGRLQTSPLQGVTPRFRDIRLSVEAIPEGVTIDKPFTMHIKITNCSERTMELMLVLSPTFGTDLHWCGISGRTLGKLPPNDYTVVQLEALVDVPGLQSISGIRITDLYLKRTYEHDDIAQVFVYSSEDILTNFTNT